MIHRVVEEYRNKMKVANTDNKGMCINYTLNMKMLITTFIYFTSINREALHEIVFSISSRILRQQFIGIVFHQI